MTPSWAIVNGKGDEHYSVIGIKHGDWPEERQTTSRWWGGGLHTNMVRQSMVFLPWSASPGGQGSVAEFQQRLIRQHELSRQDNIMSGHRNHHRHTRLVDAPVRILQEEKDNDEGEKGCTRMHKHHMYMSCTQARNPPAHHHRYFCLHHDQLMTDIAAFNSIKAAAADFRALEPKPSKTIPLTTAGSKHLAIDYEARIAESKRCQFCLSSLCKANLEIQVNFREIRVSLDWVLSGFIPEVKQGMNMRPPSNSPEYPSSPTLQARGSGQVSI
ncbi:hypothetical protein BC939DRAFT_450331 [Gamsiella multidivaricata]|uniref:uncharacterized protein n=1 Tax=Gamsiella multidivaricata TaxID=101098 RepID=UPI00221E773E|nr:uncharacterized protein BC939DRAFT_450331 [Gamsiella multidivaricata]KAG0370173.1 hypothetical protein BGZ54_007497 [Gamsiella multidivaricata]KAI7824431.1 hypothetical protein BC939DRAFT_450331 [Gamsiella multidivaricata]